MIYIHRQFNKIKKVWGTTNDISVDLEYIEDDKDGQLWKKGEPNNQGYFTLESYRFSKFLTAVSFTTVPALEIVVDVELKGNLTLVDSGYHLLVNYRLFGNEREFRNVHFRTIFGNFFANCINIFHKTEVQMDILMSLIGSKVLTLNVP